MDPVVSGSTMESEISEQAQVLPDRQEPYLQFWKERTASLKPQMVLLVARGSSDHAAIYGRYLIESRLGIPVSLAAPSVITRLGGNIRYSNCLAIGISQSGAAPDVAEILEHLRGQGHTTFAITNTEGSRITQVADATLQLSVGPEESVAATKTYSASLLALYQFVNALGGDLPHPELPDKHWIKHCRQAALATLPAVLRSERWFALGRGYQFSTALETALKLMECALIPCKGYSTADFQHGPRALAGHGAMALAYGEAPGGLADTGCIVETAPVVDDRPDAPLRSIVYGQWLALLAAQARGYDPDAPANLTKVTKTL